MKYILIILTLLSSNFALAWGVKEMETPNLVCAIKRNPNDDDMSCVSKASIEKDKLQLELIKLQIEQLKSKPKKSK